PPEETGGHVMVREAMIMTGASVARFADHHGLSIPHRNHLPPVSDTKVDLAELFRENGEINPRKVELIRLLLGLDTPRATFGLQPKGHHGLGLDTYTQPTSPLRRYVDMVVHRIIKAHLLSVESPYTDNELQEIIDHINAFMGTAASSEKYLHRRWYPRGMSRTDYSLFLQRWCAELRAEGPVYEFHQEGKYFIASCELGSFPPGEGKGIRKREAARLAAKDLYRTIFSGKE
ncbi:MAG: exoribonuclease R, partial [Parcubacteria group bacterium GW2011_GWB1_43_8b]